MTAYDDALAFIHGRQQFKKTDQLKRMKTFMDKLGNPQKQLSVIHVAGTNGKGSTVAFLRDLLMANGYTVGTFTSPFLMRFNERISIDGQPISDEALVDLLAEVRPVIAELDAHYPQGGPTEFEIITAMMLTYFPKRVDVVVVEVGIGGLLDATNVLSPEVTAITTVGFDHMNLLGETLEKIAFQKAGIIKPQIPIVIGQLPSDAAKVVTQQATKLQAPLIQPGVDYQVQLKASPGWQETFDYQFQDYRFNDLKLQMLGDYQVANAAVALTAFLLYEKKYHGQVVVSTVKKALVQTVWQGRFEAVNQAPLIVLDGAHNEPAMAELVKLVNSRFKGRDVYVLFAALEDKKTVKMLTLLTDISHVHIVLTHFEGPEKRAVASPAKLVEQIASNVKVITNDNWQLGIADILNEMSEDDLFLITGSLYFISEVRRFFKD